MQIYDMCLLLLGTIIISLMIIRRKEEIIPKKDNILLGGSMTIGTREVQEDCYYINKNKQGSFLALADGMGESYGGKIASQTAIAVCEDMFATYNLLDNPRYFFRKIFNNSNKEILKALDNGRKGYASLATALICENKLYYSVVGNVKIFVFRNRDLIEVSTGHTLNSISKSEFIKGKITRSEARLLLDDHRLYNFLGQEEFSDLEIFDTPISLKTKDIVILMTDGIYELLDFIELQSIFSKSISSQKKAYEITELVNKKTIEDKDNASIVIWQDMEVTI